MHILTKRYQETICALKEGKRFQKPLNHQEISEILENLTEDSPHFIESLCILQNTTSYVPDIYIPLLTLLKSSKNPNIIIHLLNVSRKHIIEYFQRDSKRLSPDYLETLKALLKNPNWEVKEWTVRTIDECGSQGLYFKNDLLDIYPSKFSVLTNRHKKFTRGIIDLLFLKWNQKR